MYPQIIESVKFKRLLLNKVIDDKNNLTLENYIIEILFNLKKLKKKIFLI